MFVTERMSRVLMVCMFVCVYMCVYKRERKIEERNFNLFSFTRESKKQFKEPDIGV